MKQHELLESARELRGKGYSYAEISKELHISKSTASLWARDIILTEDAQSRLRTRFLIGQAASRQVQSKTYQEKLVIIRQSEQEYIKNSSEIPKRLICALIYWCEGAKDPSRVRFTNSDSKLISTFLSLFRESFCVDESKFRVLMHLHPYHDEELQKKFWSDITCINENQFSKTFWKLNTGKVKRENYPGCVHIAYYDALIAKQLLSLATVFMDKGMGV